MTTASSTAGSRVVVGVEKSAEGRAALKTALEQAVSRSLPLVAVRAWSDAVDGATPFGMVVPITTEQAEQDARRTVEELVKECAALVPGADGVDVDVVAKRGPAGRALDEASEGATLLVVGTRGAGPLSRVLLGSVTEHVLHHARCPVVVVPAPPDDVTGLGRVLVGVDHSPCSLTALAWAVDEASRRGWTLVPVAVHDPVWTSDEVWALRDLEATERRALHDAVPADSGVRVEPDVLAGRPGRALVELAQPQDLLVVGSRGRKAATEALLGSTSLHVVRHAPCPVVVLRSR